MSSEELNRDTILQGRMRKIAENTPGLVRIMSDEDRDEWVRKVIRDAPSRDAVWVFGYGSLIWNPAFHWCEKLRGEISGYQRTFCLWTKLGRGTEENPGLMLGLEPGGSCNGVAFRIAEDVLETELDIVFRRELLSHAYLPTWVDVKTDNGTIQAVTFVMDPDHERYVGEIDSDTMIRHLATAAGPLGPNCEYLFKLVENLDLLAFEDAEMAELARRVSAWQKENL